MDHKSRKIDEHTSNFEAMRNEPRHGETVRRIAETLNGGLTPATEMYLSEVIDVYSNAARRELEISNSPMDFDPRPLYTPESLQNLKDLKERSSEASIIWVLKPGITVDSIKAGHIKVAGEGGKELLNWLSAASSLNLGGQNPDVLTAGVWAGLRFGDNNCSAYHPMGIEDEAKKYLTDVTPGNHSKFVVWESTGGGANTVAMEAAFFHQQIHERNNRKFIVCFNDAYHGNNGPSAMATGFGISRKYDGIIKRPTISLPYPDTPEAAEQFIETYTQLVVEDKVAGILLEAIQGDGGMREMPQEVAELIVRINEEYDILSIWDEVQSGMGRSGKFTATEWLGDKVANSPNNAFTFAKALANGYPISATVLPRNFDNFPPVSALTTMMGNAQGLVRMITAIEIVKQPGFLQAVQMKGELAIEMINRASNNSSHLRGGRGRGFMLGAEFTNPDGSSAVTEAISYLGGCGILAGGVGNNGLRLHPRLTTEPEVLVQVIKKVIETAELMDENAMPAAVQKMVEAGQSGLDL